MKILIHAAGMRLIPHIEATRPGHKFLFLSQLRAKQGWTQLPFAIFYSSTPHPKGSNYLAAQLNFEGTGVWLRDGISACEPQLGLRVSDTIHFSHSLHDFQEIPGGFIDGGRDYLRLGGDLWDKEKVYFKPEGGELVLCETGEPLERIIL